MSYGIYIAPQNQSKDTEPFYKGVGHELFAFRFYDLFYNNHASRCLFTSINNPRVYEILDLIQGEENIVFKESAIGFLQRQEEKTRNIITAILKPEGNKDNSPNNHRTGDEFDRLGQRHHSFGKDGASIEFGPREIERRYLRGDKGGFETEKFVTPRTSKMHSLGQRYNLILPNLT